ncbi:MAG: ABC transporter ATP-binding protein [Chloroflexi bacterium]|jgi:cobalt/nickel transport system ATP-binding protein|nr:ABC transporter ATP-binding protein [Chloroflexota bacterium]
MQPGTPALQLASLSYRYPDGRLALDAVSFTVWPGERVALVGPNGAGKSTLLLHLNGVLGVAGARRSANGAVSVGGIPVSRDTLATIRARVGLVFQNPDDQLFSTTVYDDVAYGPLNMGIKASEVSPLVERALAQVGLAGFEERMPHHLSLGERKRVAMATVLSMPVEILALDEPTAGMDPRSRRSLIALLAQLPQTLLVATHDMRLAWELCSRTILLDGGRLVADGPTGQLLQDEPLLTRHGLETPYSTPCTAPPVAAAPAAAQPVAGQPTGQR